MGKSQETFGKKEREKKREKQKLCSQAKKELRNYQKNISYRSKDKNSGGYVYLTETKRAQKEQVYSKNITKKLKKIAKICK